MLNMDPTATYKLPIKDGYLDIRASIDPEYPGLDIEYIADNQEGTRPRIVIECPKDTGELRALVWNDPMSEDYSDKINFQA